MKRPLPYHKPSTIWFFYQNDIIAAFQLHDLKGKKKSATDLFMTWGGP